MNLLYAAVFGVILNLDYAVGRFSPLTVIARKSCEAVNWVFPTRYILHNSGQRNLAEANVTQKSTLFDGKLDPLKEVVFVVHGYLHGCNYPFANTTAEEFMKHIPGVQIVNVCWSASMTAAADAIGLLGAVFFHSSVILVPCVAYSMSEFLRRLNTELGLPWDKMTMVSHSLGSYVAGFAGIELHGKIGRQIGIEPASRMFTWTNTPFGKNAGRHVIVLHTSVLFGEFFDQGTADFYANNGFQQPACGITGTKFSKDHENLMMCSHQIAFTYFKISLANPKAFRAIQCDSYELLTEHKCDDNPTTFFTPYTNATGRYYFPTTDKPPYYGNEEEISRTMKTEKDRWWKIWNRVV